MSNAVGGVSANLRLQRSHRLGHRRVAAGFSLGAPSHDGGNDPANPTEKESEDGAKRAAAA